MSGIWFIRISLDLELIIRIKVLEGAGFDCLDKGF